MNALTRFWRWLVDGLRGICGMEPTAAPYVAPTTASENQQLADAIAPGVDPRVFDGPPNPGETRPRR